MFTYIKNTLKNWFLPHNPQDIVKINHSTENTVAAPAAEVKPVRKTSAKKTSTSPKPKTSAKKPKA